MLVFKFGGVALAGGHTIFRHKKARSLEASGDSVEPAGGQLTLERLELPAADSASSWVTDASGPVAVGC